MGNKSMKHPPLETRRQAVSAVICAYPGGRDCAASRLGIAVKKFDNQAYESAGHRPLSDEQLHLLEQETGTRFLPDYLCALYGGVFVKLDDPADLDNLDLYNRSLVTSLRRNCVDQLIADALKDGEIDEREVRRILAAHRAHMAARTEEVGAVVALHRRDA